MQHTLQTISDTDFDVQERKFIFNLDKPRAYMVVLEYSGDMFNELMEEDPCAYFDLTIAINSIKKLGDTLQCNGEMNKIPSLLDVLPREINNKNMDFVIDGLFKLQYPGDFK